MKGIRKIIIIAGWLFVWQLVSLVAGNDILLVGPVETLLTLGKLMQEFGFWQACAGTLLRITVGFGSGLLLGIILAALSARYKLVEEILAPPFALIKAVPVASFVVIFLIWWGSGQLATVISFCIVLPNLYVNTLEGIKATDSKLQEMARVFRVPIWNCFFYIYRPALSPFWDSAIRLAIGMSWKSGVAAEVIGLPKHAIGEQLYMSKIYLDTAGVLAWTLVTIVLSALFERLVIYLWKRFLKWEPSCKPIKNAIVKSKQEKTVQLMEVSKRYHEKLVIEALSAKYDAGKLYYFNGPSGSGKTTLFRLLAGLEKPDEGSINLNELQVSFLFQEDRLCEEYSALKNVELVTGSVECAKKYLLPLLEESEIYKPCRVLSGGMKRRAAIARALAAEADILLLDEPYNGLDEANRMRVNQYIEANGKERVVLIASHIEV